MSLVHFVPVPDKGYTYGGWPNELLGDGFIKIEFLEREDDDRALYIDQFGDEYWLEDVSVAEWWIDVRED